MVIEDIKARKVPTATLTGYKCLRCQHIWVPKKKKRIPEVCPHCHSPYWATERGG